MTDEGSEKRVGADEHLSRFILNRNHLREDWTLKPDAFIPPPWPDLSVTHRLQLSEADLWNIGGDVARRTGKTLRGRADVQAFQFERHALRVVAAPLAENPNHANVTGWPAEKPAQKLIAQEIAAAAGKARAVPPHSE